MSAVKQDNFDDVDEEARAMVREGVRMVDKGLERTATGAAVTPSTPSRKEAKSQGLLALLDEKFPRLLDPKGKTVVWGAPPVDRIGRMFEGNGRVGDDI
jgi:cytochrome c oxidase assembly factor 3